VVIDVGGGFWLPVLVLQVKFDTNCVVAGSNKDAPVAVSGGGPACRMVLPSGCGLWPRRGC